MSSRISTAQKIDLLKAQLTEASNVDVLANDETACFAWRNTTLHRLQLAFNDDHSLVIRFRQLQFAPNAAVARLDSERTKESMRVKAVSLGRRILGDALDELALEIDVDADRPRPPKDGPIFLVHGHNYAIKQFAARTIHQLTGVEPVILHEQPNRGRTIIEKLERDGAGASFAVVLLTADDFGGVDSNNLRPRARQNVLLEAGFFIGLLGREYVMLLVGDGVEPPSDFAGIVYTPLDATDAWRFELGRELRAAGIAADLNKIR